MVNAILTLQCCGREVLAQVTWIDLTRDLEGKMLPWVYFRASERAMWYQWVAAMCCLVHFISLLLSDIVIALEELMPIGMVKGWSGSLPKDSRYIFSIKDPASIEWAAATHVFSFSWWLWDKKLPKKWCSINNSTLNASGAVTKVNIMIGALMLDIGIIFQITTKTITQQRCRRRWLLAQKCFWPGNCISLASSGSICNFLDCQLNLGHLVWFKVWQWQGWLVVHQHQTPLWKICCSWE